MPRSENLSRVQFYYNYVLESKNHTDQIYIGYTNNLIKKLEEHNKGLNKSTKPYAPWKLIYYEACINEEDAKRRERYLKTTQGRRMLKLRLKEYNYLNKH